MGNNSIRNSLTKDYIISDLRLSLSDDIYREKIHLVVEGEDDIKFLKTFVNKEKTVLYESYDGKNGVSEIVKNYFGTNKYVIGIRDKDYLENEESQKIFFYDNCCLEMMIVENEESFRIVYNEFYKGELSPSELLLKILNELKFLSIIRMCNERFQWAINIRALSINKVFKEDELCILSDNVISELNRINCNNIDDDKFQILDNYNNEIQSFYRLLEITHGHDFSTLFSAICNTYTNKHINPKTVELALRCTYRNSDFSKTRLHNTLTMYQEDIGILFLSV